jgi:hypothetical protein
MRATRPQSFATLLLPFFSNELKEPSLLGSLLLTLARKPLLGPFMVEFVDTRKYKRRDVFTGLPLPDEAEAPLGKLISTALRELQDLGSSQLIWDRHQGCMISVPARRHEEVTTECLLSASWVLPECLEVPSNVKRSALHASAHHGAMTHR